MNSLIVACKQNSNKKDWYEIVAKVYVTVTVQVNKYKVDQKYVGTHASSFRMNYNIKELNSYWSTINSHKMISLANFLMIVALISDHFVRIINQ